MAGFVEGVDRAQSTLFPPLLDDYVAEDNPVRAIDVFVDGLDLDKLGFVGVQPLDTSRPSYHPRMMLKLYIYGYLNRVPSSRRLERECQHNIEMICYNVQIAVDTQHHLIVAHEVTNVGTDRHQLANIAARARDEMAVDTLDVVADRGYYEGAEIMACEAAGIAVTLPKPLTSGAKAAGRYSDPWLRGVYDQNILMRSSGRRTCWRRSLSGL
jgi:hypothetical protein